MKVQLTPKVNPDRISLITDPLITDYFRDPAHRPPPHLCSPPPWDRLTTCSGFPSRTAFIPIKRTSVSRQAPTKWNMGAKVFLVKLPIFTPKKSLQPGTRLKIHQCPTPSIPA